MYKKNVYTIIENRPLVAGIFRLVLQGDTQYITRAGQFVEIALEGQFLRRPISVCDVDDDRITLIYKTVGVGTRQLSQLGQGASLDILTGLGNGFNIDVDFHKPLLVGGGVGIPPLYLLARRLIAAGDKVQVVMGFNTAEEVFYRHEFEALGAEVTVTTVDGSCGMRGLVTDAIGNSTMDFDYIFACGPMPMLRALSAATACSGQYSLEERMGCGFGVCMGCSIQTRVGYRQVCLDGPVFFKEDLIW